MNSYDEINSEGGTGIECSVVSKDDVLKSVQTLWPYLQ